MSTNSKSKWIKSFRCAYKNESKHSIPVMCLDENKNEDNNKLQQQQQQQPSLVKELKYMRDEWQEPSV